ncbi:peroxin 26 [Gigaspora margarita]|uniref:Peroxin 26 n=1 Tax=Gigaspora margarita TaxID=4874 RepID=A0A8H3X795_GIGMA|nr:peroxin 26 [Gigaspora margarita]
MAPHFPEHYTQKKDETPFKTKNKTNHEDFQALNLYYQEARNAFFLRDYDSAYSSCEATISKLPSLPLVTECPSTRIIQVKVWNLYVNLIAALLTERKQIVTKEIEISNLLEKQPEVICREVYNRVVKVGYDNEDGDVPGEVIIACVLLCLNQKCYKIARSIIEDWMANIDSRNDSMLKPYEKIVELYILHVLPKMKDWNAANEFLSKNLIIDNNCKQTYERALVKLKDKSSRLKSPKHTKSKKEKQRREDVNGHKNGLSHHRMDFGHKSGSISSTSHNQKYQLNGTSSSSTTTTRHTFSSKLSILNRFRNISGNGQVSLTSTAIHRIVDLFLDYLQRARTSMSYPKIYQKTVLFLFLISIVFINGWNREKLREIMIKGMVKLWETVKAGTTITYV